MSNGIVSKLAALVLLLCLVFTMSACSATPLEYYLLAPEKQPNTTWSSEYDNVEISFTVEEESQQRFSGQMKIKEDCYVDVVPLRVRQYGTIRVGETEMPFFASESPYLTRMISEELPASPEGDDDWSSCMEKYTLLLCNIDYKTRWHCVLTVVESKLDEIPVGTVLDFYKTK